MTHLMWPRLNVFALREEAGEAPQTQREVCSEKAWPGNRTQEATVLTIAPLSHPWLNLNHFELLKDSSNISELIWILLPGEQGSYKRTHTPKDRTKAKAGPSSQPVTTSGRHQLNFTQSHILDLFVLKSEELSYTSDGNLQSLPTKLFGRTCYCSAEFVYCVTTLDKSMI